MSSSSFLALLRSNRNYRFTWIGQVVSEVGDHFNNIAVFSLALANTGSGLAVAGILLARGAAVMFAGPVAGVLLDRLDRRRIMILSDLIRAVVALAFIFAIPPGRTGLLFLLSGMLMFASPFFTSGRASILPDIASSSQLHTANSLTQLTQWTAVTVGSFLGGSVVASFGYQVAFVFNALSFAFSAACISRLRVAEGFRPQRKDLSEDKVLRPWPEYIAGVRYMRAAPLILGIGLIAVGWSTGGGAAQILFSLFGENVFHRGPAGIGMIWGCAGVGLIAGGILGHRIGRELGFEAYKLTVSIVYVIHGGAYVLFSLTPAFGWALFFISISRAAVGVSSVLNFAQLLRHVSNEYRGRVFATIESWTWMTMMISMALAGAGSQIVSPRTIGAVAGCLSASTAFFWGWANWRGKLPEPALAGVDPEEVEVHGDPIV
ncbi:MAG TPA: MFS transporter [Terriglobia bacterium]|nr:MFS transporter [Terriglobia bacterium]